MKPGRLGKRVFMCIGIHFVSYIVNHFRF